MDKMELNRYLKKIVLLMMILGLLYAGANSVFGVQGATSLSTGQSSRANFSNTSSATTGVQAGNVTELNLTGTSVTDHWAGFYGDISGNITLGDSSGHSFYDWTGINSATGEVYASNSSAVAWSGIGCINITEIASLESSLGITATDADRINQTYTSSSHPAFTVGGTPISGCNSTNANTDAGKSATTFYQILLTDTGGNPVYTTLINDSTTGFDAVAHDFELLVGESDSVGTTPLYFYLELS